MAVFTLVDKQSFYIGYFKKVSIRKIEYEKFRLAEIRAISRVKYHRNDQINVIQTSNSLELHSPTCRDGPCWSTKRDKRPLPLPP